MYADEAREATIKQTNYTAAIEENQKEVRKMVMNSYHDYTTCDLSKMFSLSLALKKRLFTLILPQR